MVGGALADWGVSLEGLGVSDFSASGFLSVFLIGLLGGAHCIGMCGGIVSALSSPVPGAAPVWSRQLAYNFGRIASYALIGGLVGAIGSASMLFNRVLPLQLMLFVLANLMLIGMGLYLMGFTRALAGVERGGQLLWRRIQPLSKRFLPVRSWRQALPVGFLWGFLPCGLTYSVLSLALVNGSAVRGAGLMLAFGAGTLPNLLFAGILLARYRNLVRSRSFRLVAGLVVLFFGIYGLIRAPELGGLLWAGVICEV
ncbi:sulfite exporter TauE/SafE family protein [Uliginosibacterium aquaticum]|uniref:Sulfite exporter TauE/SafE family protein n=1 Tax=Uliginosibacterium aquaticum TaxID=2731212 RepID=A0ABX2IMQ3_9RHOO|nr:sulfite exporter TauE/SafE family protein [Uliginosibacterium aquaticum]NSL55568.1 sulfite exporter TauE/SafE family protein [Uliginosibacterium aquaticum]